MVLREEDFVHLPFPADASLAGVEYTKRNLNRIRVRDGRLTHEACRKQAARVAVELTFRRFLEAQDIPFLLAGTGEFFTAAGGGALLIGGRRCEMVTSILEERSIKGEQAYKDKRLLRGIVGEQGHMRPSGAEDGSEVLVFTAGVARIMRSREESGAAEEAGIPLAMSALLPDKWLQPDRWQALGGVQVASESGPELTIEMAGCDADKRGIVEEMVLHSGEAKVVSSELYTLGSINSRAIVNSKLTVELIDRGESHLIGPHGWGNVWVYGRGVLLLGYLTRGEFETKAKSWSDGWRLPGGMPTGRWVAVSELRPIGDLFDRVLRWQG